MAWGKLQPMEAAITVTAWSDNIFTGTCSPKMGTIDIGDPDDGDPEDAGSTRRGIPNTRRYAASCRPISKNDRFATLPQGGSPPSPYTSVAGLAPDMAIS
jgi:hypothetical protein